LDHETLPEGSLLYQAWEKMFCVFLLLHRIAPTIPQMAGSAIGRSFIGGHIKTIRKKKKLVCEPLMKTVVVD